MEFKTQYSPRERVFSNVGSKERIQYAGHYDEKGRVVLEEVGRVNLYDEIQSHADSCDIHTIMRRYANGDYDALSQKQGFYADVTEFPSTYAEALNRINDMEGKFMSLPLDLRKKFNNSFSEFLSSSGESDFLEKLGIQVEQPVSTSAIPEKEESSE